MKYILTASKVESWYKKPVAGNYADGGRLYLCISESGTLSFRYRMELHGIKNWITLGRYPAITLSHAREIAVEYSQLVARGINPKEHKERQKTLNISISDLCAEYLQHKAPLKRTKELSLKEFTRAVNNEIVAKIGTIKLNELTAEQIHKRLIQPKIHDSPASVKKNYHQPETNHPVCC